MNAPSRFRLDGRVAVITGASRNIGLATARLFADSGAHLVITAGTQHVLEEVAADLRSISGSRIIPIAGDIGDSEHLDAIATRVADEFGGADVLVNNALISLGHQPLLETDLSTWELGLRSYLEGPLQLARRLVPAMAERGHGSIVNLVSTAAFQQVGGLGAYGVMKAAMWSSTQYLAAELAPAIRVNAVCPGTTSESGDPGDNPTWARVLPSVPLARMATPDETAHAILYLASDASSYTTGGIQFVDGGRVSLAGGAR